MSSLRTWVAWSAVAAILLVSPALALLAVIAAEAVIDLLAEAGGPTVLDLTAVGALGWALLRRMSARWEQARQLGSEDGLRSQPVAAKPG